MGGRPPDQDSALAAASRPFCKFASGSWPRSHPASQAAAKASPAPVVSWTVAGTAGRLSRSRPDAQTAPRSHRFKTTCPYSKTSTWRASSQLPAPVRLAASSSLAKRTEAPELSFPNSGPPRWARGT